MTEKPRTPRTLDLDALAAAVGATGPQELQARLVAAMSPFAEARRQMAVHLHNVRLQLRQTLDSSGIRATLPSLGAFVAQVQALPLRLTDQLVSLAQHGWYIDPEMAVVDVGRRRESLEGGDVDAGQAWFVEYYREHLDAIEQRLCERHPKRAKVIAAALRGHRAGEYALSVPVMLAQADGIAVDLRRRQLYSKRADRGIGGLASGLPPGDFDRVLWSVFQERTPLSDNTSDLPVGFDGLNRHAVLHGLDPDYGTEINSLKALSLLNYTAYALESDE